RVRFRGGGKQSPRPRSARDDFALARLRSRETHVPQRRTRLPFDRRAWARGERVGGVIQFGRAFLRRALLTREPKFRLGARLQEIAVTAVQICRMAKFIFLTATKILCVAC